MKNFILLCLVFVCFTTFTFANYQRNIQDEYKIYLIQNKVTDVLKKAKNPESLSIKYRNLIEERLGKEISYYKGSDVEYKSFSEYALVKIYEAFHYESFYGDFSIKDYYFKHLENKYIKTFSTQEMVQIDDNSIYYLDQKGIKRNILVFFEIDENESLKQYIEDNLLEEKYVGKCRVEMNSSSEEKGYYLSATDEYAKEFTGKDTPNCGKYSNTFFVKKSDTLIFQIPFSSECIGVDFSLIELKK